MNLFGWFDKLKQGVIMKYLTSIIRHALTALGALLVGKGRVDQDVADNMVTNDTEIVLGVISYIIGQVCSCWTIKKK